MRAQLDRFSVYSVYRIRFAWLCITIASLLASAWMQSEVHAAQVTLRWDYSASGAAGFVLYCGPSSRSYPTRVDVGNTDTYTIGTLAVGATSFCAVTAYDSAKVESDYSNELSVFVPAAAPTVDFSASPGSGTAPLSVAFTNATSGQVTSWVWDFGDGTTSTAQNPTHVYSAPGSYKPVLTAAWPGGTASKTATTAISVAAPAAPVVNFSASPASGTAPVTVAFNNTTTGQVTSWAWNFGDGTTSIVKNPTHVYSTPGSYKATLTATGPGGTASKTAATAISVSVGGTPDGAAPTVAITAPSTGATVAGTTTVSATASDNVGVVGVQFLLDGVALGSEQPGPSFSLPWSTNAVPNGVHSLSARARDAAGNTALAATVSVTVSNTQPVSLVAAYAFNEGAGATMADASGNANTATIDGATWTSQGKFGGALTFNGMNNWVTVNDTSLLDLTAGMTLEAWVYPTTTTGVRDIVVKEGASDIYNLYARNWRGLPEANVLVSGSNRTAEGAALAANVWTHVAGTYDGTTVRLYINGAQVASTPIAGAIATSTGPLRIGGNSLWGEFFQGQIDEVRVYNRALSQAEIQTDMNAPVGPAVAVDTTSPSTPTGLTATLLSSAQVKLAWTACSDNVGVTGYRIERCQGAGCSNFTVQMSTPSGTTLNDTGVAPATSYSYRVRATDAAGNLSGYSNVVSATTLSATQEGLVAAYAFNEGAGATMADASGNANTATIDGATWTSQGKFGGALTFNGMNNWVTVNDTSLLDLTAGMTLEAWVYPTTTTGVRDIVVKEGASDIYNLYARNWRGLPEANVLVSGSNRTAEGAALAANVWTHVAGTYDGTTVRLYINGAQVASTPIAGAIATSTGPLRIGGNSLWGEFFQGQIDEVRVYNRALSQAEIQTDMSTALTP